MGGAATASTGYQFDGQGEFVGVGQRSLKPGVFVVYHGVNLPGVGELFVDFDNLVVNGNIITLAQLLHNPAHHLPR